MVLPGCTGEPGDPGAPEYGVFSDRCQTDDELLLPVDAEKGIEGLLIVERPDSPAPFPAIGQTPGRESDKRRLAFRTDADSEAGGQEYRVGSTSIRKLTCGMAGNLPESIVVEEIRS